MMEGNKLKYHARKITLKNRKRMKKHFGSGSIPSHVYRSPRSLNGYIIIDSEVLSCDKQMRRISPKAEFRKNRKERTRRQRVCPQGSNGYTRWLERVSGRGRKLCW